MTATTDQRTARSARSAPRRRGVLRGGGVRTVGLLVLLGVLLLVCLMSLRVGPLPLSFGTVFDAITNFDGSRAHLVVSELRVPRTVIGVGVGAALAVAGAIMQAVTRNPLAGPGILGVSAGSSFAIVIAIYLLGITSPSAYVWFAFAGALGAVLLVYAVGSVGRAGATPVKLALAGVVVTALLTSWIDAIMSIDLRTLGEARFWIAGSLAGRDMAVFWQVSPFLIGATLLGLATAKQLNALSLGDEVASALGQRTVRVRLVCGVLVVLLAGTAVAVAGPIAFVGLAVPHIARALVGADYRWILAYGAVLGPMLLVGADIVGRALAGASELPTGIVTAVLGAPFLVYLARRRKLASV